MAGVIAASHLPRCDANVLYKVRCAMDSRSSRQAMASRLVLGCSPLHCTALRCTAWGVLLDSAPLWAPRAPFNTLAETIHLADIQ